MTTKIIIENDATKAIAQPAVIVAGVRTGGTFLSHCLSNHPDIFCDRAESLHQTSVWHANLTFDRVKLLYCLTHMQGYRVSMCKMVYTQAFKPSVWKSIVEMQPRVIWLTRENVIRQTVSMLINRMAREGKIEHPAHSFDEVEPVKVELAAEAILAAARRLVVLDEYVLKEMASMSAVLRLTYEQVTQKEDGLTPKIGRQVCEFLGVRYKAMACDLKRSTRCR